MLPFKFLPLIFFVLLMNAISFSPIAFAHQFTTELGVDNRYFLSEGAWKGSQDEQYHPSLRARPEYSHSFLNDRHVITLSPYYRHDMRDEKRSHFDMRELSWFGAFGDFSFRLGISKVFWGVTESFHLVDVINQTDYVESLDGKEKLGQPMVEVDYGTTLGRLSFFVLPTFREKTFTGKEGRFRNQYLIDHDHALYQSTDKDDHIDFATRYSHYIGGFDFGLSFFKGTDRNPTFVPTFYSFTDIRLRPYYAQTAQYSADLQWTYESLLLKFEGLNKRYENKKYQKAFVAGAEYTFSSLWQDLDVGPVLEYLYNKKRNDPFIPFSNHLFLGGRLAFNDTNMTQILIGLFIDHKQPASKMGKIEASRRLGDYAKISLNSFWTRQIKERQTLEFLQRDSYVELNLSLFF